MRSTPFILTAVFLAACGTVRAEDWKLSASANFDTGKYGTDSRTSSLYIPFTLKRYYPYADVSVTVPYLRQSSTGVVTRVGGSPVRAVKKTATVNTSSSEAGLGDVLVRGSLALRTEKQDALDMALVGKLKLPTADEKKGLGTGQMDEGFGLELAKAVSPRWTLLADAYYTIIGDPSGVDYNNELAFDLGVTRPLAPGLTLTALYETRSALVNGNPDPRDLSFTLERKAGNGDRYSCGLLLGLSDGSPDLGVSAGVSRRF